MSTIRETELMCLFPVATCLQLPPPSAPPTLKARIGTVDIHHMPTPHPSQQVRGPLPTWAQNPAISGASQACLTVRQKGREAGGGREVEPMHPHLLESPFPRETTLGLVGHPDQLGFYPECTRRRAEAEK